MGVANLHHRLQLKAPSCIGADFALGAAMAGRSIADEAAAAEVNAAMVADLVACFMARVDEASEAANSFVGNSLESAAAEPWDDAVPQQVHDPEGASSQTSPPSAEGGADAGDDEGGESIEVPLDFVVASHDPYLPIGPAEEARAEEPAEEAGAEEPDQDRSLKKPKLEEVKAEPVEEAGAEDPAEEAGAEALPVLVKEMERLERQKQILEDTSLDVDVLELLTDLCEANASMQQERCRRLTRKSRAASAIPGFTSLEKSRSPRQLLTRLALQPLRVQCRVQGPKRWPLGECLGSQHLLRLSTCLEKLGGLLPSQHGQRNPQVAHGRNHHGSSRAGMGRSSAGMGSSRAGMGSSSRVGMGSSRVGLGSNSSSMRVGLRSSSSMRVGLSSSGRQSSSQQQPQQVQLQPPKKPEASGEANGAAIAPLSRC